MPPLRRSAPSFTAASAALWALLIAPGVASALPGEYLSVTDPLQAELRLLELYAPAAAGGRVRLPGVGSLPLRRRDLMGPGEARVPAFGPRAIALMRIERELAHDATSQRDAAHVEGVTPRAWHSGGEDQDRVELSLAAEGAASLSFPFADSRTRWRDGSGAHARIGAKVDRWLAYSHLWAGQLQGAERFTDALAKGTNLALQTEESYLAYDGGARWGLMFGRNRWHWGPGDEASLLLSRTSAPLTGLMLHLRFESLRLDATALHATLDVGSGEQLAAHRLEWQVRDGLRLGATETARYRSSGYQGVYLASVIPFSLAQRLLDQDAGADTSGARRNNVMLGLDAAWRVADGTRVYGELLIDDLHAESGDIPNKLGFQLGAEGVGDVHGARLSWGTEYTRLSRFVYTSFYGRTYAAQGAPIGFPTGPDSERLRARIAWDPDATWQVAATASRTSRGESGLASAFIPGAAVPDVWAFAGTPERERRVEGALRWWPASGIDLAVHLARTWRETVGHVVRAEAAEWDAGLAVRLTR